MKERTYNSSMPPISPIMANVRTYRLVDNTRGTWEGYSRCSHCLNQFKENDQYYSHAHLMCKYQGVGQIALRTAKLIKPEDLEPYLSFDELDRKFSIDFDFIMQLYLCSQLQLALYEERGKLIPMAMIMNKSKPKFKRAIDRLKVADTQYRLLGKPADL